MSLYADVQSWRIPRSAVAQSISLMAADGLRGCEGLVMWLGRAEHDVVHVTDLVALEGDWVEKQPLYLRVSEDALNALADLADTLDTYLVGQIHSHPDTFVDLSWVDRASGISVPNYLSLVAPYYAQRPDTSWLECGIHVFEPLRGFRRLAGAEADTRIHLMDGEHAGIHLLREQAFHGSR